MLAWLINKAINTMKEREKKKTKTLYMQYTLVAGFRVVWEFAWFGDHLTDQKKTG